MQREVTRPKDVIAWLAAAVRTLVKRVEALEVERQIYAVKLQLDVLIPDEEPTREKAEVLREADLLSQITLLQQRNEELTRRS